MNAIPKAFEAATEGMMLVLEFPGVTFVLLYQ